jgi:chromatin structure-remodeling complex subunit RSC1/2
MADHRESETPIPTTENGPASTVTDAQYDAMQNLLTNLYEFRLADGHDPSKLFHRKVNKRMVPDYYDVIKEPMAMSTIKAKINQREYKSIPEFVRDWALIAYNAQVYNVPNSGAYQDALVIKDKVQKELAKMVEGKVIAEEGSKLPFLGEIPTAEDIIIEDVGEDDGEVEGSEVEEEDEDDEEDGLDDSDDEGGRRRKRKGVRGRAAIEKRESRKYKEDDDDDPEARKKRGRPPRVDTPMEARIKEILKSMRKFKNSSNTLMVYHFERLPDKAAMPEYYDEVKSPIALDVIKKKFKRKKYNGIEPFMRDIELMFENAKSYNTDESQVYQDAVYLQKETRKIAEEVKKKPDTDFVMEDGRIPMPDGILHNGELWKVGVLSNLPHDLDLANIIQATGYTFRMPTILPNPS